MNSKYHIRIRILSVGIALAALVIIGDLYLIQIVKGDLYREKADRQYARPINATFDRGSIFFEVKDGTRVTAAGIKDGATVAIIPKLITDTEVVYEKLKTFISLDKEQFLEKAARKEDPYEEIAKRVDRDTAVALEAAKIPGVRTYKDTWRTYPANGIAAHSIGFIGYKGDVIAGRYGLERYYEDTLSRNNKEVYVNFFAELFSGITSSVFNNRSGQGDIVTTIEPSVQSYVESVLVKTKAQWNPDTIGAIIINPKTGEIYAMAALPGFNPNDRKESEDPRVYSNPLVENVYEMGSILKPLTVAAGLDAGVITAATTYDDKGFVEVDGKKISNFDFKGRGVVPMQEILSQSLNTGIAFIVKRLGNETMTKYFLGFGLGEKTGIDQPNEAVGINSLKTNQDIDHVSAGFGQSIATTPIETVRALSVLANGGTLITPHLVQRIEYDGGSVKEIEYPEGARVIKKETSEEITRMLIRVVDEALRKGVYKNEHYTVAAKTGTAQIAERGAGGYYKDRYLHSFFNYFPAYNPQFLVFMYQVYPKGAQYASETLTAPVMDINKFLINYYEVPPDR